MRSSRSPRGRWWCRIACVPVVLSSLQLAGCGDDRSAGIIDPDPERVDAPPAGTSLAGSVNYDRSLASAMTLDIGIASALLPRDAVFRTDYVTAGVSGLRNVGSGSITLGGVTGPVSRATLYWHGVTNTTDPSLGETVAVNGTTVTGEHLGFSADNGWGFANSQAWAADVTAIVQATGNGVYVLSDFGGYPTVNPNGASLVVFFADGDPDNDRDVVVFAGNDSNATNPFDSPGWDVMLAGINYTGGSAGLELHVADGQQLLDAALILNGLELEPEGIIFGGFSVPGVGNGPTGNGRLWDIRSWDVTSWLIAGANSLHLTSGRRSDLLALVVVLVDLPAGAAPDQPPSSNAPPVLNPIGDRAVDEGSLLAFTVTASDPDGDPLTFSLLGAPPGASIDAATGAFAWTPPDGPATATFNVVVSDGSLSDDEEITVTVHNVAPAVDAGADATITAGGTFAIAANFTDPGAGDAPWAWHIDWGNGTDSEGTATSQASPVTATSGVYAVPGAYTVVVTVTDKDGGAGGDHLTLTVQATSAVREACSPGFWGQNGVRRGVWPVGYAPSGRVSDVFDAASGYLGSATLLAALQGYKDVKGRRNTVEGAGEILLRSAVAAVLNEAAFGVGYPAASVAAIQHAVNGAVSGADRRRILELADLLDRWNNNLSANAGTFPGLASTVTLTGGSCPLPRKS
jgi:hypothetical protein